MDKKTIVHIMAFQPQTKRSMNLFLRALTQSLTAENWRSVFVFSREPDDSFRQWLIEMDLAYFISEFPLTLATASKLAKKLRPLNPDVIVTRYMSPFDIGVWYLKTAVGARSWIHVDGSSRPASPKSGGKLLLARLRGAIAGRFINQVIAVSHFVARRDVQQSYLPAGKVRVCYNGVDTERFTPSGEQSSTGEITIAYAGQLIPEKGVLLLMQAVKDLVLEGAPPLRVRIAGIGSQAEPLKQFCGEHNLHQVEFLGQIDWVPGLLACSDLVVVPSRWDEAFGFVVAEAMACGVPVIASDAGGIPEVIGEGEEAGLIFRNGDLEDLKVKLRRLMADPALRERVGQSARERAVQEFSISRMVELYRDVILEQAQTLRRAGAPLPTSTTL